ncbi:MAG: hypothetical protein JO056_00885 [Alphaproteobacteria bacterium]|nr:hypothetical protein [Alphaproteobacteria bacterium]
MAAKDDFDRASLGSKWVVPYGNLYINNNQLQGDTGSLGYHKKSSGDSTVIATAYTNGSDLEYAAVAVGDIAGGTNAFVKLQAQDGTGNFTNGAFYTGNNGSGYFFVLDSPVPSPAIMTVSVCGTVATLKIKSAAGSQKYSYDYGASVGTGGGLGTYGNASLDNYKSKAAACTAAVGAKMIKSSQGKDLSHTQ